MVDAEMRRAIRESLVGVLERDGLVLERDGGRRRQALCPFHSERTPSFKVWPDDGNWFCFGCQEGGDAADYIARRYNLDRRSDFAAILELLGLRAATVRRVPMPKQPAQRGPIPPPLTPLTLVAQYDYRWPDGGPCYQVRRYEPKTFRVYAWVDGVWQPGMQGRAPLLYRLPEVLGAAGHLAVSVFEGEKDADRAWSLGLPATCNSGGAGNWPDGGSEYLNGRDVVIFADNDAPGERHAQDVARSLKPYARAIRVVRLPGLKEHGDFSDWLDAGGTLAQLDALCAATPYWTDEGDELRETGEVAAAAGVAKDVAPPSPAPQLIPHKLTRLSEVVEEPVRWLWPGYIPLNELTILDGDPGLGKSAITLDLAARVSSGAAMPDGSRGDLDGASGVVLLSCENDLSRTVLGRLRSAGADLGRVCSLDAVGEGKDKRLPTLLDVDIIAAVLAAAGARLVVIDPLMAYMPAEVNSFRDQDVRRVLAPLAELAKTSGVAIVVVRHLNKAAGGNPLYRGGGSIGIIGAARVGLLVAADPADPSGERRILAQTKNNLARLAPALLFTLAEPHPGDLQVAWGGVSNYNARTLLADPKPDDSSNTPGNRARRFLQQILANGPVAANEVLAAAEEEGISEGPLNRAKSKLGIISQKDGFGQSAWTCKSSDLG